MFLPTELFTPTAAVVLVSQLRREKSLETSKAVVGQINFWRKIFRSENFRSKKCLKQICDKSTKISETF